MNSGFRPGAPRGNAYIGVTEDTERGGYLPHERGVGRIGKGPISVPLRLAQAALGSVDEEKKVLNPFFIIYDHGPLAKYQRLMEWSLELSGRLGKIVKTGKATAGVPYSVFLGVDGVLKHSPYGASRSIGQRRRKGNRSSCHF